MQIRDINKPITSKTLNETLAKQYGTRLDTDSFTLEQLQDARNKVRSKVFDIETNESYGGVDSNETYGKNKLFLDVLNAAILERDDIQDHPIEEAQSAAQKAAFQKMLDKKSGKKPAAKDTKDEKPKDGKMPMDDNGTPGDKSDDKPAFLKKKNESKHIDEGKDIINNYFTSLLKEGAEDNAEIIMASKDMVDRLTGWMEDTAEMQSESMLELADAIRDEMGQTQSDTFVNTVKPALEQLYGSMETTRVALTSGVSLLTGEGEAPAADMGAPMDGEEEMAPEIDGDVDMDLEPTVDDEFAAAGAAAGGTDEAGRAKRESKMHKKAAMLEQSRRLGSILSKKK
jgi:hypothetical protein|tara:strand:+ start:805 stop:1830 length:1026 start_codon:yes stop_codon:yes gene_type:complete